MADQTLDSFRQMLLQLGRLIRAEELNTLKFACKDDIPTRQRENITSIVTLFEALEERGKFSKNDVSYLKSLLKDALSGRTDVLHVVAEYETAYLHRGAVSPGAVSPDAERSPGHQTFGFRKEIQYLEDNLGKECKFFLRCLIADHKIEHFELSNSKFNKEVIHQCLCAWLQDSKHLQHADLLKAVIAALKKVKRYDLAECMEKGRYL
uniref:DED domain-containing protein n=1 Tax=Arion vulgaris TaxID=1028688 RepID=A0A0B6ZRY6_9EUPU